jgi:hypothetical protein
MVVVNIVGFPYKLRLRSGIDIVIPYDNQPHEVPDEIAENNFNNVFQILVPPKPKVIKYFTPVEPIQKSSEIIEINLEEEPKIEEKIKEEVNTIEEIKEEIKQPPLKGIKIKSIQRDKLIKKGKWKIKSIKSEELNNGNN